MIAFRGMVLSVPERGVFRSGFKKRKTKAKTVKEKVLAASDGETASHERALCTGNKKGTGHLHAKMIRGLDEAIKKILKKKNSRSRVGRIS